MKNIFREEVSRAFLNKRFLIIFLLAGISFAYGFFQINSFPDTSHLGAITVWQIILRRGHYGFFASLLAALPFADSLSLDKATGFINHILTRTSYRAYIGAKIMAVILSGLVAVVLPAILLLLFCWWFYPANPVQIPQLYLTLNELLSGNIIKPENALNLSPSDYLIICLLLTGAFGATYAMLAMGMSFHSKNSPIVLGVPFICYSFGYYFIPTSRHLNWLISSEAALIPSGNLLIPLIQYSVLCASLCIHVVCFGRKETQVLE